MEIDGRVFTVGADPELFIQKDGKVVSAYGLVPGTKSEPFLVNKGAVQIDGMATEFNIDPAIDEESFIDNLESVKLQLASMLPGYEFAKVASNIFDDEVMKTQPLEALMLGCEPDFNCYTREINPKPDGGSNMRTTGGHIHIGGFPTEWEYDDEHFENCSKLISLVDETVGVYSLLWDKDDDRRSMYGMAGAFRPKRYGVEYRSPSCLWTFDNRIARFVYKQVGKAIQNYFTDGYTPHKDVQSIINNSDRKHKLLTSGPEVQYLNSILAV